MPSCKSFNNFNQYSSRHRCAMRADKLNDTVRVLLEAKSSHSRSTRQQGSFIIEFRRWLVEFWNSVINRLKSVFSNSRNLQTPRSLASKITNMDPDRENAFWRDGGPRYIHQNDHPKIKRKTSNTKDRLENRDSNSRSRNHRNAAPIYSVSYKNNQWSKPRRRSTRKVTNFTATETTDEEYLALYKKSSHSKENDKSNERHFSNSSGDCVIEPIETILSRYNERKFSKSAIELKGESSMEALEISDERNSKEKPKKSLRAKNSENISLKSTEDGKWIETNCFGSLRYSQSELNITPERKTRTRNQVSRIPRLRHLPEKRSARAYRTKNDARPSRDNLMMQHRRYYNVNRFSDSLSEFGKSEDELYDEEYYQELRNSGPASESHIFRRWLLTIIDIPNALTNRLRDWLRPTPESRGSTSDKSSGTNSVDSSGIRLTGYSDRDGCSYNEKFEHSVKHNHRHCHSHAEKHFNAPSAGHRCVKNHHVYHIYKQNEMGIERVVGGHRNYSTSWLQRNGRFSSSPVLVLPRIDPDTGLPICHPRRHHSRTATERRSVTHTEENLKGDHWRNSGIWKFQENHYTHLRGDTNLIEGLLEKENIKKSSTAVKKNSEKTFDDNQDSGNDFEEVEFSKFSKLNATGATAFRETISMRVEVEEPRSLVETIEKKDLNSNKIEENFKIKDVATDRFRDLPKLSTVTQNNVDALLNNLREKINSLHAEKKFNRPVVRLSSLIDPETGSQDRDHLFGARWHEKSGLFARDIKPPYTEARASFAERIQDIWTQEKTASQWAVLHNHKNIINGTVSVIGREEHVEEEKEIVFSESTTNEISNDRILKMSATQSSINYEISKPTVCHIGVQYSIPDSTDFKESHRTCSQYIETNNEDQSEIPQILKAFNEPNEIPVDSIQLPPSQEIQAFVQYEVSEVANDFISPLPVVPLESKASTEILDSCAERNVEKTLSAEKNLSSKNIGAKNSQFPFPPQEIRALFENKISEIATTERLDPSNKLNVKNTRTLENVSSQNINDKNVEFAFQRQQKSLRCPLTGLRKIRSKPPMRFSRSSFINPRKSCILRCRFPKKVGLWLASKFHSGSRRGTPISVGGARSMHSTKSSKLTCTMRSIFKCIQKTSEINVSQGSVTEGCPVPTIFQSNVRPMPPIRKKKLEAQSSTVKIVDEDKENAADTISETRCIEDVPVDLSAIEPTVRSKRRNPNERSMTTLSVTTSNSTNIPLQLLGSTSDTSIVPSYDSQDDFKRQVDESNGTEIATRTGKIETCEETGHYSSDSFLPEGSAEVEKIIEQFKSKDSKKIQNCSETKINGTKILTDFSSDDVKENCKFERKRVKVRATARVQRPKEHIPVTRQRRREYKALNNVDVDKKRSLGIDNFSTRLNKLSKTKMSASDKNAGTRNSQKLRLERRVSRIDIIVDKSQREEPESKSAQIRNAHNRRLERRETVLNISADDSSNKADRVKSRERKEPCNRRGVSSMELESMHTTRKLRQRMDSPMIPHKSTDSQKRRSIAAGKSSLIPVGIGNARCLPTLSKTNEKNAPGNFCNKTKLNEEKNGISAINSSLIARPSLKKSPRDSSESRGKRNSNCRVRFEVEKKSSKETELKVNEDRKKRTNYSENLFSQSLRAPHRMNDKKIVRKVKSSLENGLPLKRITIMDPCLVSKITTKSGAVRSKVEKYAIDQAGESYSANQNFMRRERTRLISQVDNETVYRAYPHGESSLSEQTPKPDDLLKKRHHDETKISYRSLLIEKNKNEDVALSPVERSTEGLPGFVKSKKGESLRRRSIIDFARIRERVENEILEQTSRSSGTEDCDCAIVLIKAINSSMELSDA